MDNPDESPGNAIFPAEHSANGAFERQEDAFRHWVTDDSSSEWSPEPGRYHLYISLACPWASRTLIIRNRLGLQKAISCSVVDPIRDERGWAFRQGDGYEPDPVNGFAFLAEAYQASDPQFAGRVTVPVLWDRKTRCIVNNSEDDICRMLAGAFRPLADDRLATAPGDDPFPADIEKEHRDLAEFIYENVNNGVYSAGFATCQSVYEEACRSLFEGLDRLEARLDQSRYLFGTRIVEADWRLFCTLIRFDVVYHGHFKCNLRRIVDYTNLQAYLKDLYHQPGIAEAVNFDHIKRHYYITHDDINPTRIVPLGPVLDLEAPHGRLRAETLKSKL